MTIENYIQNFKDEFDPRLHNFFNHQSKFSKEINLVGFEMLKKVSQITLEGGKRFRPFLAYIGYLLIDNSTVSKSLLLDFGISLELFHSFALIHDDIMDRADFRRKMPTIEFQYSQEFASLRDSKHLAISGSILAGDLAYALSNKAFGDVICRIKDNKSQDLINIYHQMQIEVCYGQSDDTLGVGIKELSKITEKEVLNMLDYKSGKYSIEKPLLLGAILGGLDIKKRKSLAEIGVKLGIAFQLIDDILGVFGKQDSTGKSVGGDICEGKRTLLITKCYQKASHKEQQKMLSILGNKSASQEEINFVKSLIKSTKSLADVNDYAQKLVYNSIENITKYFEDNSGRKILILLSEYILQRSL